MNQVIIYPLDECPLKKVGPLHSVKDVFRASPHVLEPLVALVDPLTFEELLDQGRRPCLLRVSRAIEFLYQRRATGHVAVFSHLFARKGSLGELFDDVRTLAPRGMQLPHLFDVDPGPPLDLEDLAQHHHIVGLAPELKVDLFCKVPTEVLLDDDRVFLLLEAAPGDLGQEHTDEALNVDDYELELHVMDSFPRTVAPVAPLYDSGGE